MHLLQVHRNVHQFVLLCVFEDYIVDLFDFVLFLVALGNNGAVILEERSFFAVLHEACNPALGLSGDLVVDSLDFVQKTSLGNSSVFLEVAFVYS